MYNVENYKVSYKDIMLKDEKKLMEQFKCINSIISMCEPMAEKIKGKDIVILLGNTKAGKSSLCHYIIGNKLTAAQKPFSGTLVIHAVPGSEGPPIGQRSAAETTLPTIWPKTRISEVLVDAPGFDDNRGEKQDIANCFYIKNVILNCRRVKFVLVSDINDVLRDNINSFITFLDNVNSVLPNLEDIGHGVCLVFTKDSRNLDAKSMCDGMNTIYEDEAVRIEKSVLRNFINNENNIAFFRAPTEEGSIDEDIGSEVIKKIKELEAIPCKSLLAMKPALSDKSRAFLLFAEKRLSENPLFFEIVKTLPKDFEMKTRVEHLKDIQALKKSKTELQQLEKRVKSVKESVEKDGNLLNILQGLNQLSSDQLRKRIEDGDLKTILQFIDFINDALDRPGNAVFKLHFELIVEGVETTIAKSLAIVKEALHEITQQQLEKQLEELVAKIEENTKRYESRIAALEELIKVQRKRDAEASSAVPSSTGSSCRVL